MALPPISPPGSPTIQPFMDGGNHGLPTPPQTPPQTPQQGGVVDFGKVPPLSLSDKKVQEPAQHEDQHEGGLGDALREKAGKVADHTWAIPGLSAVAGGIADSEDGAGGALKGAAGGVKDVMENNVKSLEGLPTSPKQALVGAYLKNIENSDRAPELAKNAASKV
jgi:hypothetical protein